MKPCERQIQKDTQSWNWCPAFRIEPRLCPWLGRCFSFYTLVYRMQVQTLVASPLISRFSIPPELNLVSKVRPGCHAWAQFAMGPQVRDVAGDGTRSRLAERKKEKGRSTASNALVGIVLSPSSTPKLGFQCEFFFLKWGTPSLLCITCITYSVLLLIFMRFSWCFCFCRIKAVW